MPLLNTGSSRSSTKMGVKECKNYKPPNVKKRRQQRVKTKQNLRSQKIVGGINRSEKFNN